MKRALTVILFWLFCIAVAAFVADIAIRRVERNIRAQWKAQHQTEEVSK